jgi:hypothetical protein
MQGKAFSGRPGHVPWREVSSHLIALICPRMMFEITANTARSIRDLWEDSFIHARGAGYA